MKGGHLRGARRPRRPFSNGLSRLPSPPLDSFRRREWEASFASGRSAVWRRAARPCTLGRPGVQVAKGSPVLDRGDEGVRVRVGRWQVARSARSNESCASLRRKRPATAWILPFFILFSSFPLPLREGPKASLLSPARRQALSQKITADGGSLGSRVDEERSQLRESM